jgi:hypothetical protein
MFVEHVWHTWDIHEKVQIEDISQNQSCTLHLMLYVWPLKYNPARIYKLIFT